AVPLRDRVALLTAVSQLELQLAITRGQVKTKTKGEVRIKRISPVPRLSSRWAGHPAASDRPTDAAFNLARAVAGITPWGRAPGDGHPLSAVPAVRANLVPVRRTRAGWEWDDTSRSAVWSRGAALADNLLGVLRRRLIDAQRGVGD